MPQSNSPYFRVRNSRIHGRGAFAVRRIRKGTRIIEYGGERITNEEAERRYPGNGEAHEHTVLFAIDKHTCIDGNTHGNAARFINHSCAPNCESFQEEGRVFIRAIRNIQPGAELSYDYALTGPRPRTRTEWSRYLCRCGSSNCRGTMLDMSLPRKYRSLLDL